MKIKIKFIEDFGKKCGLLIFPSGTHPGAQLIGNLAEGKKAGLVRSKRNLTYYPCRRQEGHKIELMLGKHRKRRINPPVYPIHPNEEKKKNLNNFITYKDLKIRWRNTSKNYRKKVTIARKWKNLHCLLPMNKSSCIFILHKNLPYTRFKKGKEKEETFSQGEETYLNLPRNNNQTKLKIETSPVQLQQKEETNDNTSDNHSHSNVYSGRKTRMTRRRMRREEREEREKYGNVTYKEEHATENNSQGMITQSEVNYYEKPPREAKHLLEKDKKDLFCIMKSNFKNEHKVTIGDIIQTEKLHRKKAGDVIYFGTVLLVGSKNFTIIGKPTVPYCRVKATIEQITLSNEILSFRFKKVRRSSRFLRIRHWLTILKINDIILDIEKVSNNDIQMKDERVKPLQIIDLWSNRWLYKNELNFIKFGENNKPLAEKIYSLIEHQPNTLLRRVLLTGRLVASGLTVWPFGGLAVWRFNRLAVRPCAAEKDCLVSCQTPPNSVVLRFEREEVTTFARKRAYGHFSRKIIEYEYIGILYPFLKITFFRVHVMYELKVFLLSRLKEKAGNQENRNLRIMGAKFEFFRFFKLNYYAFYVKKEKLYTFLHTTAAYSLVGLTVYLGYSFFHMWNDAVHYSYKHYIRKEVREKKRKEINLYGNLRLVEWSGAKEEKYNKQRKELYEKIRNARESGLIPKSEIS
ncbi:ribosomal protein, putative [Plasmodium ovale curtisi]|uniref:Large ribosomal subunit protein bL21m n=1 Tax=Plasmodium ovale curtisi TaxID=864141 RepID=A0A1A8W8C4_PLAOA|nr:ribosomal protein, putative [Plasmodium ovale curtisi]